MSNSEFQIQVKLRWKKNKYHVSGTVRTSITWTFTKSVTLVSCHFLQYLDKFLHPVPIVYLSRTYKIETVGLVWDMKNAKSSWFTVSEKRFYDPKRTGSWQSWLLLPLSNVQFSRELCDVWSAQEKLSSDFFIFQSILK